MKLYKNLGILGSGQLGRMFTQSASNLGANVFVYSPEADSPTFKAGAEETVGDYLDKGKLFSFLNKLDALSFEFENIPEVTLHWIHEYSLEKGLFVAPSPKSILISRHRIREKTFFQNIGLNPTLFFELNSLDDIQKLPDTWAFPCILKTNTLGYDGKGQWKINSKPDLTSVLRDQITIDHILEKIVPFEKEISVIIGRFKDGTNFCYPPSENIHTDHILDISIHPARIPEDVRKQAMEYAIRLAESLNYVGILGLEMFWTGKELVCNEFAPRPHNSGHFTMDTANFSQFDLQARILLDIKPSEPISTIPVVMKNIIGPNFFKNDAIKEKYIANSSYRLYLYQKKEAKHGRKMGHINYMGEFNDSGFTIGQEWKHGN